MIYILQVKTDIVVIEKAAVATAFGNSFTANL